MTDNDAIALDLTNQLLIMRDGPALPVTDWFDMESNACGPFEAISGVAGPTPDHDWIAFLVSDFGRAPTLH